MDENMKIAILGRKTLTANYEKFFGKKPFLAFTTLNPEELDACDALVLPGGGDITPAFFGENNTASANIDTELDILQLAAVERCLKKGRPILGICKGMQIINVALGGTIVQDLATANLHRYIERDQYHSTILLEGTCLYERCGRTAFVNSAHHQGLGRLGDGLLPIQWCTDDGCVEAVIHESLPVLGLQWHPERLDPARTTLSGEPLLELFASWISAFHRRSSLAGYDAL
ncbi:MAG: gamma-glutamyl-gamma-aminobutyrate hydrolase family protein [Candidatus Gastranaerophilales bacterium]|nr:gamma-glutamyl-gamma-aminobutyrate hydrolase family protein [Candidatus Gastranaerophilales bacterium]